MLVFLYLISIVHFRVVASNVPKLSDFLYMFIVRFYILQAKLRIIYVSRILLIMARHNIMETSNFEI